LPPKPSGFPPRYNRQLKQLRKPLTQVEFAKILGLKHQQYNRYEKGHYKPPLEILEKISTYGKVSIDWILLGDAGKMSGLPDGCAAWPEIGRRIRQVREEEGLSQEELGQLAGFTSHPQELITEIEGGEVKAPKSLLAVIESVFNVNQAWLLTGELKQDIKKEDDRFQHEIGLVLSQVRRILKYGSPEERGKLKGFLAALDPGGKEKG